MVVKENLNPKGSNLSGYVAAIVVIFVWSSWLVASRAGATSNLTIFDLGAMRYGLSGLVALPIVAYYKPWRTITFWRAIGLSFILGPAYMFVVFAGFTYAPVAHAGAFMNGFLPIMSLTFSFFVFKTKIKPIQKYSALLILLSAGVLSFSSNEFSFSSSWRGDLLFILAGMFFTAYVICNPVWKLNASHILFCGSVINGLYYIPIWFFFLPSGLQATSTEQIIFQSFYQGLVPTLFGLLLIGYAARTLGSNTASTMMAGVPGVGAILGVIFLGETLEVFGWLALLTLTTGIIITSLPKVEIVKD